VRYSRKVTWGDLCDDDKRENELSVKEGFRILSAYRLQRTGAKLWIITEADRSATTFLLPEVLKGPPCPRVGQPARGFPINIRQNGSFCRMLYFVSAGL
jgi:hypothetical protein